VVLLAILIVGIPDEQPAWVFGAATATALLEGIIDTVLLMRFLARLPADSVRADRSNDVVAPA